MAAVAPVFDHGSEVVAEGIDAEHGHGAASDDEVVGGEGAGAVEGAGGGLLATGAPEVVAEAEFGTGELVIVGGELLEGAQVGGRGCREFVVDPAAEQGHLGFGGDVGVAAAGLGGEGDVVGADDAAVFVDPEDGGDVDHVVELGEAVVGVDQAGVGRLGGLDPLAGVLGVAIDGDGDDNEAEFFELLVDRLPPGQVVAAASPRGVGGEEHLLASVVGEGVGVAFEVGEGEVRSAEEGERLGAFAGGDAEVGGAFGGVDRGGATDQFGEASDVDAGVGGDIGVWRERVADGAEAEAFGLEFPLKGTLDLSG